MISSRYGLCDNIGYSQYMQHFVSQLGKYLVYLLLRHLDERLATWLKGAQSVYLLVRELVQYFVSQLDQWLVLFVSIRMIGDRSVIVIVGMMLGSTVSALFGAVVGAAAISALE